MADRLPAPSVRESVARYRTRLRSRPVTAWWLVGTSAISLTLALAVSIPWIVAMRQIDLQIYWGAISGWLGGESLYDFARPDSIHGELGFTYPPFAAVVMAPLGLIPVDAARVFAIGAALLTGYACMILMVRSMSDARRWDRWQALVAAVLTVPAFALIPWGHTLGLGQVNLVLMLLVLFDVVVLMRRRSRWTGVGVGISMAIKLTPGVFLLLFALAGRWRALIVAVATAAAATVAASLIAPGETWRFFTSLLWDTARVGHIEMYQNTSVRGALSRIFHDGAPVGLWVVLVGVLVGVACLRARSALLRENLLAAATIVGILGVLASPVSWLHHAVWVVPALLLIAQALLVSSAGRSAAAAAWQWTLFVSGLVIWLTYRKSIWNLPIIEYGSASALQIFASCIPTLWLVLVLVTLPIIDRSAKTAGTASNEAQASSP